MLAERKFKQKFQLNPRGKQWSDDGNKFGQKMLEKMGWSKGKGLGCKEDGATEHVTVSFKNDTKGMGFKETDDQWTVHNDIYNNLLANLQVGPATNNNSNTATVTHPKSESLVEKSEKSKVRLHYGKFTRSKDLTRYSDKDLANIFGKKTLKKQNVENEEKSNVNGGSMVDYFKKKLSGKRTNPDLQNDSNSGIVNKAFDPLKNPTIQIEKHNLDPIIEEEQIQNVNDEDHSVKNEEEKRIFTNPRFQLEGDKEENPSTATTNNNNKFEVKRKKRKIAFENNAFSEAVVESTRPADDTNNPYEVKRSKKTNKVKKRKLIENTDVDEKKTNCKTTIKDKQKVSKHVDVTVDNDDSLVLNVTVDTSSPQDKMIEKIEAIEAQIENDMNEAKCQTHSVRLTYANAKFMSNKTADYHRKDVLNLPKRSYKHLIKSDIIVDFPKANFDQIAGYHQSH